MVVHAIVIRVFQTMDGNDRGGTILLCVVLCYNA